MTDGYGHDGSSGVFAVSSPSGSYSSSYSPSMSSLPTGTLAGSTAAEAESCAPPGAELTGGYVYIGTEEEDAGAAPTTGLPEKGRED